MITSAQCLAKYGAPSDKNPNMVLWDVPENLEIGLSYIAKPTLLKYNLLNYPLLKIQSEKKDVLF